MKPGDKLVSTDAQHKDRITVRVLGWTAGGKLKVEIVKHNNPRFRGRKWIIPMSSMRRVWRPA